MPTSATIILVEDDEGHARLIEKNLRRAGVQNPILHFTDGTTALDELLAEPVDTHRAFLILLDLNLPDMSGADILIRLKADARLRRAPVVILTTTDDHREMQRCYDLGASVYVTKPVIYEDFAAAIRQLGSFFAIVQIPELSPL